MGLILLLLAGVIAAASIACGIWLLDKRERLAQQQRQETADVERALDELIGPPNRKD